MTAAAGDRSHHDPDPEIRARAVERVALLTPIAKSLGTDIGVEVTSLAVQVHGGMGFVEETGAAQHYRDARIAPIYEGTNGIQAADLVGRKLDVRGGDAIRELLAEFRSRRRRPAVGGRRVRRGRRADRGALRQGG